MTQRSAINCAGDGGAGDGLVAADQIENDAPIDVARRLAAGDRDIVQIDFFQPASHNSLFDL
jgi:hypothetical protein